MVYANFNEYEPIPHDGRKSFYHKCRVYEAANGSKALKSYQTVVMTQDASGKLHRHWRGWSATTARHIACVFGINTKLYRSMEVEPLPLQWWGISENTPAMLM